MFAKNRTTPEKLTFALAWLAALIVLPLYAVKVWQKTDYTDFEVYYRSAARAAQGDWLNVYTLSDGASPFRYAPVTIPFFRPFAALTLGAAKEVWYFLQYSWFILGLYFIYLTLRRMARPREQAAFATAISGLFILRFCLDCFTIGQISSLLFLCFCGSFYAWVSRKSGKASLALTIPALVKIGPGFLYPLFLHGRPRARVRAILSPMFGMLAVLAFSTLWIGPWERNRMLWSKWWLMVTSDSQYYDASHYGSQSLKSALLRMVNWHWLSPELAMKLYAVLALLICVGVLAFWLFRFPRGAMGRAAAFALGIFPYLWVMPETFKYSLTVLAIPVGLLVTDTRRSRLALFALAFGAFSLSLAGKDLVGDFLFFGSQKASVPLLATFFLGAAIVELAWRHSRPAWLARELSSVLRSREVAPWDKSPGPSALEVSLLAPLPMQSATSLDTQAVLDFVARAHSLLEHQGEILIQPYGDRLSEFNPAWAALRRLAQDLPSLRLLELKNPAEHFPTRNAALRESFLSSQGRFVLTAQLEQPCDVSFYEQAIAGLRSGHDLIRGNRRHEQTRFRIPVRLLSIVFQRHRLGLLFNRLVRLFLPIQSTDTHSGTLAMSREFATQAFALQSSYGFLFDLELALVAQAFRARQKDLPVTLILAEEKSRRRMGMEALSIFSGLPRLAWRYQKGYYSPFRLTQAFTADDWGLTPEVNRGILELAKKGVIRRVSVMARSNYLTSDLGELLKLPNVELGLHFDLTYGKSSPARVLLDWIRPLSDKKDLKKKTREEFRAQLSRLQEQGIPVRYVDGHHHIHLVPGILDSVANELRTAGIEQVRCPYDPALWWGPKAVLNLLSVLASRRITALGFRSLPCFYPQSSHFSDAGLFRAALQRNPRSEIIVHPARSNDLTKLAIPDPYTEGRVVEYRALRMLGEISRNEKPL